MVELKECTKHAHVVYDIGAMQTKQESFTLVVLPLHAISWQTNEDRMNEVTN